MSKNKTKYKFQTVVVNEQMRQDFSTLRDKYSSTDKELAQAMFDVAQNNIKQVENIINANAKARKAEKVRKQEERKVAAKAKRDEARKARLAAQLDELNG